MKEQLSKLIEMYASARASNNPDLIQYAAEQLNEFLNEVEIRLATSLQNKTDT
jgi:hypothetical protein